MRSSARALVSKGVRALVIEGGSLQDRLAKALPEAGYLAGDAGAVGSLTQDESARLQAIQAVGTAAAVLALSDEDAASVALEWWALFDLLSTTS